MVDCFDRIAVQITEIALEPVLRLAECPTTMSATVSLPSDGRRVLLTVSKRFPPGNLGHVASHLVCEGGVDAPVYAWILERRDDSGRPAGTIATSLAHRHYPRPEDAFWGAVDALRDVSSGQRDAG